MSLPKSVTIVDVSPRDGLQNEKRSVSVETKLALVEGLADAGVRSVEVGSFVSPKWVPQMAGSEELFQRLPSTKATHYSALVPNLQGLERALNCGVKEVAIFTTASESFSQKNTNCSVAESLGRIEQVVSKAIDNELKVRGYISCIADCPYEGPQNPESIATLAGRLYQMGCYEISLGDTLGTATPGVIEKIIGAACNEIPISALAMHLHDTYGQALANIYASLQLGISTYDSSLAGLGGCPYAKGAGGNIATEDVVYMLNGLGIETGFKPFAP